MGFSEYYRKLVHTSAVNRGLSDHHEPLIGRGPLTREIQRKIRPNAARTIGFVLGLAFLGKLAAEVAESLTLPQDERIIHLASEMALPSFLVPISIGIAGSILLFGNLGRKKS